MAGTGAAHDNNWMPLYIGDYLRDTARLTAAQHGAYLLLIMDYWVNGPPPDDDRQLAAIVKSSPHAWKNLRQILLPFFKIREGYWHQKRIDLERNRASELVEKKRRAGLASGTSRQAFRRTPVRTPVEHSFEHNPLSVPLSVPPPLQEKISAPYRAERSSLAHALAREDRRDGSPPLPSQGDGGAPLRSTTKGEPPPSSDSLISPAEKVAALAELHRAIDAARLNGHAEDTA